MKGFCANISWLYTDRPVIERIAAAKEDGFDAIEMLSPYDEDGQEFRAALRIHEMPFALMNCPPPNRLGTAQGFAAVPALEDRFHYDLRRCLRFAKQFAPEHIHIMAGESQGDEARATFIRNLQFACDQAPAQAFTIEPLNAVDMPGYFLHDYGDAADIIAAVDRPNLGLQFDAYHASHITGAPITTWDSYGHLATHIQIAGFPNRDEPTSGLAVMDFLMAVKNSSFTGWISAEYRPTGPVNWLTDIKTALLG
ncbi:MAG: hydroxypyruvate isomerase family protein [Halocynthiibacter sp.]